MRRTPLIATLALVAGLLPVATAASAPEDPLLEPPEGALVGDTTTAHAESADAQVDALTLDDADIDARQVMSGEPFAFVFEGSGLNTRYVNGIEVAGERVYTIDGVSSWATESLSIDAELITPGDNEITLFTGTRPGICNMDDFSVRNVRLQAPDGTEIVDPDHPASESVTLGDGSCGSNDSRLREVTYTFNVPSDAGTGPLGRSADLDAAQLDNGSHALQATTADGAATEHTVWTDDTITRPDTVSTTLSDGNSAAEQVVEAEEVLPPVAQDISVAAEDNCCSVKFNGDGRLLAGQATDDFDAPQDGDSFTLDVPVAVGGRYEVALDVVTASDYGTFTLDINGQQLGDAYDAYSTSTAVDRRVQFGTVDLEGGIVQLTFTVAGANSAADGRMIGLDAIRLEPVPPETDILSPSDGAVVRGDVPIVGYTADTHPLGLQIDGTNAEPRQLLGGESASFVFEGGGGNGLQSSFKNRIAVRGQEFRIPGAVQNWTEDAVDIPAELLQPGENTVTFIAGLNSGCNHDDFDLRNIRLELPDGTVLTDPTVEGQTVVFGDSICDDTVGGVSKALEYDFTFVIPEPGDGAHYRPGMGKVWDTTTTDDGAHTVTLAHRDGSERTSNVVVDNTAPEIVSTVPAQDGELKGSVTLAVEAQDATSGIATTAVTIDGEEYPVGEALSSDDLTDGAHEMTVTITDLAGNETSSTMAFTSIGESPDEVEILAPADGATDVEAAPELRVSAVDPAGDPLTVSFFEAQLGEPAADAVWNGSTSSPEIGGLGDTEGAPVEDVTDAIRPDDTYLAGPESEEFPYQRFDLPVPDGAADLEVSWEGTIDQAREIVLFAYDLEAGEWTELSRHRGDADGNDLRIQVPVGDSYVDDSGDEQVVHVLLQGSDPFADDIEDVPDEQFRDPETFDFSIAWMTDTQYLSEGAAGGSSTDYRFAAAYREMTEWIADNADARKIDYVAHTGDIINNWHNADDESDGYEATARAEFEFASETMTVLENAGVPFGVTPGNHDNKYGTSNELFNEYFPPSRFEAASENAEQPYYGGSWKDGDYHNHYDLFSAGGQDFIVVYLGMVAGDDEIQWANDVLQQYSDRKAIFATHEYLMPSMQDDGRNGPLSTEGPRSQGIELFDELILPNENVFLTLSGHTHGVALNIKRDVGAPGRTVVEMLANYQFFEVGGQRRTGHFRLLQFDVDRSEVSVNTYSPVLDDHNAEEFDTQYSRDYTAEADEFTVPVDLDSRVTQFQTDAIYLAARTSTEIGSAPTDDEGVAAVTWDDLSRESRYGWYAVADDGIGGVTSSDTATFTTEAGVSVTAETEPPEADGDNGWYVTPPTVTGSASDESATVEYNVDGSGWAASESGVTVDDDGEHTVEVRAVLDEDVSDVASVDVSVDATDPSLTVDGLTDGQVFTVDSGDTVAWSASDETSGVASEEALLDDSPVDGPITPGELEPGDHTLAFDVADQAGNTTTQTFGLTVVEYPVWDPSTVYTRGDKVTWEGKTYFATWWNRNKEPGEKPHGPWQEIAPPDEDGVSAWTNSRIYNRGDVVSYDGELWEAQWWNRNKEPGAKRHGPWEKVNG